MAERRMFAKTIVGSDAFLDMSPGARLLYYELNMAADDDGVVNSPRKIIRMIGAADADLDELEESKFVLRFPSGVVVIKHWRINNYIRKDVYKKTKYKDEIESLFLDENGAYSRHSCDVETNSLRTCDEPVTDLRQVVDTGKVRLGKDRIDNIILAPSSSELTEPQPENGAAPSVLDLPLNDNSLYPVTEKDISELQKLYPAVDVTQQLRNMIGWLNGHPRNRKTSRGIKGFINSWLAKEQNRARVITGPYMENKKSVEPCPETVTDGDGTVYRLVNGRYEVER